MTVDAFNRPQGDIHVTIQPLPRDHASKPHDTHLDSAMLNLAHELQQHREHESLHLVAMSDVRTGNRAGVASAAGDNDDDAAYSGGDGLVTVK